MMRSGAFRYLPIVSHSAGGICWLIDSPEAAVNQPYHHESDAADHDEIGKVGPKHAIHGEVSSMVTGAYLVTVCAAISQYNQ